MISIDLAQWQKQLQAAYASALGLRIKTSNLIKPVPRLKLSVDVPVSSKFRVEMDQWLLDRFGTKFVCYQMGDELIVLPETYEQLRKQLYERLDQQGK